MRGSVVDHRYIKWVDHRYTASLVCVDLRYTASLVGVDLRYTASMMVSIALDQGFIWCYFSGGGGATFIYLYACTHTHATR